LKVLLFGPTGQLGSTLLQRVPAGVDVVAVPQQELDFGEPGAVRGAVQREGPALVINAAAYTQVDRAEVEREAAFQVNAEAPRVIAEAAAQLGSRMIHVSTDFVFDGERPVPWEAVAPTGPLNVYGESKLAGEQAVVEVLGSRATVVRTSWLYAVRGHNFVHTMLNLMRTRESLGVVSDQVGTPTWAASLAGAVWDMAQRPEIGGVQHWSDEGVASWYDFAVAIQEEGLARGLLERAIPIRAIRTEDYPTPARRPRYSVLDKRRTASLLGYAPPHWRVSLRNMLDELAAT
jgi:dTDP-4-dehydrorhamnose reductase